MVATHRRYRAERDIDMFNGCSNSTDVEPPHTAATPRRGFSENALEVRMFSALRTQRPANMLYFPRDHRRLSMQIEPRYAARDPGRRPDRRRRLRGPLPPRRPPHGDRAQCPIWRAAARRLRPQQRFALARAGCGRATRARADRGIARRGRRTLV